MQNPLTIDTAGEEAAVDSEYVSGDEARCVRGEKNGGADEFVKLSKAAHRCAREKFLAALGAVEEGGIQIGAKNARGDGIDANTFARPLDGKRFCERCDSSFAGGIGGDFVERDEAGEGSNINDAAVAALDHVTANDAASTEGAGQICFEDGVPLGVRKIEGWSTLGTAGTVDENLNAAELLAGGGKQILDCRFFGDVTGHFERAPAEGANFFCGSLNEIHAPAGGHDIGAGLSEALGEFKTDAAGAPDDKRGFIVQFELRMAQGIFAPRLRVKSGSILHREGANEE